MSEPTTVGELLDLGERVLADSTHIFEDHDRRREAEELMSFTLGTQNGNLPTKERLAKRNRDRYLSLIARRAGGEPFPLLTGRIEFFGLDLRVRPGAFVPRPSSELTVSRALKRIRTRRTPIVVDVCTGAGPIALAVADEMRSAEVWGIDISEEGLLLGRSNARALGINNVRFKYSDMYGSLPRRLKGSVDVITGHVPYVPVDEVDDLPAEVKDHEPIYTLTDSQDGMYLLRRAITEGVEWLAPSGWLLLEVSEDLGPRLKRMYKREGLEQINIATDSDRLSIVVEGRKSRGARRPTR